MISTAPIRRASASPKFGPIALGMVAMAVLAVQPAWARKDDRQQQMHADASKFDGLQQPNSISTLTGNVVITQGTLKATGDLAKIYLDADSQISRVVIFGNPARVEQQDDNGLMMHGHALNIDYNTNTDIAVLTGSAYAQQETKGEAHADKLVYDTNTSMMTGESQAGTQVHMVFEPKPQPGAPAAKPAASPAGKPASTTSPAVAPAATPSATPAATPPATAPTTTPSKS